MCDPITFLAIASVAQGVSAASSAKKAAKTRKAELKVSQDDAAAEKRTSDLTQRDQRKEDYQTRRRVGATEASPFTSLFSQRSFFRAA